jgi:catechol 2,3-dioxygenase-like lactoylglutathione lyase family enzyme
VEILQVVLRTQKLQDMIGFYVGVLNCTVERQLDPAIGLTQLRAGDALIDLVDVDSDLGRSGGRAAGAEGRNLDHLCLRVTGIDEAELAEYLQSQAIAVGEFAERYGADGYGRSIYIADPDGNTVELRIAQKR